MGTTPSPVGVIWLEGGARSVGTPSYRHPVRVIITTPPHRSRRNYDFVSIGHYWHFFFPSLFCKIEKSDESAKIETDGKKSYLRTYKKKSVKVDLETVSAGPRSVRNRSDKLNVRPVVRADRDVIFIHVVIAVLSELITIGFFSNLNRFFNANFEQY